MNDRKVISREMNRIEADLKELEIRYEQYFAGVEKREPLQDREQLARRLRRFANRRIIQTDLRFRYQSLATRFHSYAGYWDRILRLMDEGRYVRQLRPGRTGGQTPSASNDDVDADAVYRELLEAHSTCRAEGRGPSRQQVAAFLEKHRDRIRERFGNQPVEFRVVTEQGKPKIKVRPKK